MRQEIKDELDEVGSSLAGKPVGMPHTVPEGYFNAFAASIGNLVSEDEQPKTGKQLPYNVPGGYFDNLPKQILEKATLKEKRKGILVSFKQVRWAAAAVLFIAIGLGAYNTFTGNNDVAKDALLASVGDADIREYLAFTYHLGGDKKINAGYLEYVEVDTKEIVKYLDETGWGAEAY